MRRLVLRLRCCAEQSRSGTTQRDRVLKLIGMCGSCSSPERET